MAEEKLLTCPHCAEKVIFKRNSGGRWAGTIFGAGVGGYLCSGLGLVGAVASFPIAMGLGVTVIGAIVLAGFGNRVGKWLDNSLAKCPNCGKTMVL